MCTDEQEWPHALGLKCGHTCSSQPACPCATGYSLRGSNTRPMAHKTIALTTELREHLTPEQVGNGGKQKLCRYMARVRRPGARMLWPARAPDQTHEVHGGVLGHCAARGPRNGADNLAQDVAACRAPACAHHTDGQLRRPRAGAGRSAARRHDLSSYSLRGSSLRPMAHKTIALTTELREPWELGWSSGS